jgi:site-specific DNA-methyltransferase (adenine-specific)
MEQHLEGVTNQEPQPNRKSLRQGKPFYRDRQTTIFHNDCFDVLPTLPADSVHAVVTDPPYGLRFMDRKWDSFGGNHHPARSAGAARTRHAEGSAFGMWCEEWARECLRVLRPGGHLVAFGGSRTWHHLAVAIENAGFEIRDSIAWLYGSGFPKSLDVSKALDKAADTERQVVSRGTPVKHMTPGAEQGRTGSWAKGGNRMFVPAATRPATEAADRWQGWGTGLKPAFEPIIVARKSLAGTVAVTVGEHGTGAINVDACRVPMSEADRDAINAKHAGMSPETYKRLPGSSLNLSLKPLPLKPAHAHLAGRWPPNVAFTHPPECGSRCLAGCPVAALDRQSGRSKFPIVGPRRSTAGDGWGMPPSTSDHADAGGASRFFPAFRWQAKAGRAERPRVNGLAHPTVKPLALVRWLVRLVTPPGGLVVDPFLGSGTTAEAARLEGVRCIGIERDEDYLPLIRVRLRRTSGASRSGGVAASPPQDANLDGEHHV